jgi:hypothetical protein
MSNTFFPAVAKVSPSFSEPALILTYAQPSGAFATLPEGKPRAMGEGDLYVYVQSLDIRSQQANSQFAPSKLPSATLTAEVHSTQTYNLQVRCEYDHVDTQAASNYAVSLPSALDFANKQGIYQGLRSMLLYGLNPSNNEGLLNTAGATAVTLPPDHLGNTTLLAYDNGDMVQFFQNQITQLISGMFQTGAQSNGKVVVLSPQRVGVQLQLANIVQVTSYQRPGAGTATVAQVIDTVGKEFGLEVEWYYDDTLIGKGAAGADAVLLTMPEIDTPAIPGINTNEFGKVNPHLNAVNVQYTDMAAPMRIPTPIPDGAITEIQRLRATCGWSLRPVGLYILSIPY